MAKKRTSRIDLNADIVAMLDRKEALKESYSLSEIEFIQQYTGLGGLASQGETKRGILYEYYTPVPIVKKMWGLAYKHGFVSGTILEPSVGTGRFLHYADPTNNSVMAFEFSKDDNNSYRIAKASFPWANIINDYFESIFYTGQKRTGTDMTFDLVIGNPPYGKFSGFYAGKGRERNHTKAELYEQYFIEKGIELLNPNGLLVFIIPSSFLDNGLSYNDFKKSISEQADLVDAYRMPANIFSHTQIQTDIIVLKKKAS